MVNVGGNFYYTMTTSSYQDDYGNASDSTSSYCKMCKRGKAPRVHHCKLCDTCVLKRDHHCFFMGICVGLHNQKYFIVYCFYQFLAAFYFVVWSSIFLARFYGIKFSLIIFATLPLRVVYQAAQKPDMVPILYAVSVALMYATIIAMLVGLGFFLWQMIVVTQGLTTHEYQTTGEPSTRGPRYGPLIYLKEIFDNKILTNFIFPLRNRCVKPVNGLNRARKPKLHRK